MCVGRRARGGAWRPPGSGPRAVARAPGFVRCEAGRPGSAKAGRARLRLLCLSFPLLGALRYGRSRVGGEIALLETEALLQPATPPLALSLYPSSW